VLTGIITFGGTVLKVVPRALQAEDVLPLAEDMQQFAESVNKMV